MRSGLFTLGNLRGAAGFAATVTLAVGIEASTDDNHHCLVTYFVWYGLSAALVVFVICATIAIERRKAKADTALPASRSTLIRAKGGSDFNVNRNIGVNVDSIADVEDVDGFDAEGNVVIRRDDPAGEDR